MKIIRGGKEVALSPEDSVRVQEAIKNGQAVVQIDKAFYWVQRGKDGKSD